MKGQRREEESDLSLVSFSSCGAAVDNSSAQSERFPQFAHTKTKRKLTRKKGKEEDCYLCILAVVK